jgi:DNA recombination protein RmuC
MTEILLGILVLLALLNIMIGLRKRAVVDISPQMKELETSLVRFETTLDKMEKSIRDEFQRNRNESNELSRINREELARSLKSFEEKFSSVVKELQLTIEKNLKNIREDNDRQLGEMRRTVDEKLQTTLEKRLGESFKQVSERLEQVHKGLGEMQTIASGVGDLKKVLSNVKTRGVLGEYQLGNILEQILTGEQYSKNVATKKGSQAHVEYAIRLPGKSTDEEVWMPVDSKFPIQSYETLMEAYELGSPEQIESAQKVLIRAVEGFARDISEKYIDPPHTTDFGIMFLPVEGLYAEVLRHPGLFETLQRTYKITVTGPTTLSALLNSLQMGFRTLAVQKRSSEVWSVLGAVKSEFSKFSEHLGRVQKQLHTASGSLETLRVTRTNQIERKLRSVETLDPIETREILELPPEEAGDEPKED